VRGLADVWSRIYAAHLVRLHVNVLVTGPAPTSLPQRIASQRANHSARKPSTTFATKSAQSDFCNKICTKRTCRDVRYLSALGAKRTST